jgi:glycosyltransferase involved in cell wall biosynthesis
MISVVIPLYNKENHIIQTINSVLNQSHQHFELLVVNDGSKDRSLEIVKTITDPRVRIIDKPNGGVSSARNAGIQNARYDYIAFLDGDDFWHPGHLELIDYMIKNFDDESVGGFATKFLKSKERDYVFTNTLSKNGAVIIDNYIKETVTVDGLACSSTIAIKKKCFGDVGLYNEGISYSEDVELYYRLFKKYKLVTVNDVTAIYFTAADNRSDKKIMPLAKRFHQFNFTNKPEYEKQYLGKLVAILMLDYAMQGAYKISLRVYWKHKAQSKYIISYFISLFKRKFKI